MGTRQKTAIGFILKKYLLEPYDLLQGGQVVPCFLHSCHLGFSFHFHLQFFFWFGVGVVLFCLSITYTESHFPGSQVFTSLCIISCLQIRFTLSSLDRGRTVKFFEIWHVWKCLYYTLILNCACLIKCKILHWKSQSFRILEYGSTVLASVNPVERFGTI